MRVKIDHRTLHDFDPRLLIFCFGVSSVFDIHTRDYHYHLEKDDCLLKQIIFQKNMFFVFSRAWDKQKILSPQESNLRLLDSALRCSTTELQRLNGERGLLRSSYDTRPAYCQDQQCRQRRICNQKQRWEVLSSVKKWCKIFSSCHERGTKKKF